MLPVLEHNSCRIPVFLLFVTVINRRDRLIIKLTNSMGPNLCQENYSAQLTKKCPGCLQNTKLQYYVHNSLLWVTF
jgi:hypothetical protein